MAGGTDFHADIAFVRRSRLERVPTGANDVHFVIRGVNTSLHWSGILSGNYSITKRPKKHEPGAVGVTPMSPPKLQTPVRPLAARGLLACYEIYLRL